MIFCNLIIGTSWGSACLFFKYKVKRLALFILALFCTKSRGNWCAEVERTFAWGDGNGVLLTMAILVGLPMLIWDEVIEDQLNSTPPCHKLLNYLILSLSGVVAMKYQAKSEDPFETHPPQTWSFVAAILSYPLLFLAIKQLQNRCYKYADMLNGAAFASGVLSSFSLLSLLLPYHPGLVLLKASWALSAAIAAWPLLQCTCYWLFSGIQMLLNGLTSHARSLLTAWNLRQQAPPRMPV